MTKRTLELNLQDGALSPKRKRFCEEYVVDHNATQAAMRAGYSKKTACSQGVRLLSFVEVAAYIAELEAETAGRTGETIERVVSDIRKLIDRCMQAEEVFDKRGNPTGQYRFEAQAASRGLDMLMKHIGAYRADNEQSSGQSVADFFAIMCNKQRGKKDNEN